MINDRALEASARAKLIADRDVIEFLNTDGLLGKISVEDKAIPIFTFEADDERKTILYLYRRELNDERIQICLKAAVYRDGHEIISMPFIHLYAPQHSRYTRAELADVDASETDSRTSTLFSFKCRRAK